MYGYGSKPTTTIWSNLLKQVNKRELILDIPIIVGGQHDTIQLSAQSISEIEELSQNVDSSTFLSIIHTTIYQFMQKLSKFYLLKKSYCDEKILSEANQRQI